MIFEQRLYLNSTSNAAAAGSGVVYGFGKVPKTNFSVQVSFYTGQTGQPPSGGTPTSPSSADVQLLASQDAVIFDQNAILDWQLGTNNVANGSSVYSQNSGPVGWLQVNWNITWGSATTATVTIRAVAPGDTQ